MDKNVSKKIVKVHVGKSIDNELSMSDAIIKTERQINENLDIRLNLLLMIQPA